MTDRILRIATRKSQLALWQAGHVRDRLLAAMQGEADWPHNVYRVYWPQSSSQTWQLQSA